jgi:two-component system cell cycle sensor histidine kinase/response regulator CckA
VKTAGPVQVHHQERLWLAYALAVLLPVVTLLGRLALGYKPGDAPMLILFVLPSIICAFISGLGPGLTATAVSALVADYFLLRPTGGLPLLSGLKSTQWLVLFPIGILVSVLAEARNRSERRFRALTEHSGDSIALIDADNKILYLSPSVEMVEGYKPAELIGRNGLENTHPDDLPLIKAAVAQLVAKPGQPIPVLWRRRHKDGRWLWLDGTATNLLADPAVRAIVTNYRDVTERKLAEEELRWKTTLFEAQLNSTIDGILVVDSEGKKMLQNERMRELWKIPREYAEDKNDTAQLQYVTSRVKDPKQFVEKVLHLYSHPDEVSRDEIEVVDGMVLDRYSSPVCDKQGKRYGRIWTFRDITERKQLEEQLRQAQKMEAIGQLAGGVAHDFNNMLTAIIGHLGLLRTAPGMTPEIAGSLKEIGAAANRAAKLTSQLLAFSRRQVMSTSVLDLNEVVTNLTNMLHRMLGENIVIQLACAPGQLAFQGDAGMMEQVLVNLAVNARDAMPDGGTLKITTRGVTCSPPGDKGQAPRPEPSDFVKLSVSDTGTGIAPEIRSKIFEPFFTTKDVGKGTGLGLATVFGIVQQHHGWVELESEVGHGATFHIHLPRVAPVQASAAEESPALPARGRGELVLLVEDEPSVQDMGMRALSGFGYRVLTAANGPAALAVWAKHKEEINLLLTDMIMPEGISGMQLARQLLREKPSLKVIYSSGYNAQIAGKDLKLTDGINFLAKPYELDRLFRTVRAALDGKQSRSPFAE